VRRQREHVDELRTLAGQSVLVTGGTGFVGLHVLRQGRDAGIRLWNFGSRVGDVDGVTYLTGDLRDADAVRRAVETANPVMVLHLATLGGTYGSARFADMVAANITGFDSLLRAARMMATPPHVIATGSALEYADQSAPLTESSPLGPSNEYSITKAAAALLASYYARGMRLTLLRLFNVYGPGEPAGRLLPQVVSTVREGKPVELTHLESRRDFVYVSDAAEAVWRSALRPASSGVLRTLNVGTGQGISFRRYIEAAAEILRSHGYEPAIRFGAKPSRPGEAMNVVADVTRLREALGWVPATPLRDGLRRTIESSL